MGVLFKKIKNTKLSIRLIYFFVLLLFLISYILLFRNLIILNGVETKLRIIILCALGIILILYSFFDLILLLTKKYKTVVVTSFLILIISSISIIGSLAINKIYVLLNDMNKDKFIYTTNLIALKDSNYVNDGSFKVGIIDNENDIEGNILAYKLIDKENLNISVNKYENYPELLEKLYNKEVDGIFITSEYQVMYEGYEGYENIGSEVKVLYEYSKEMKNQDNIKSDATVTEPFTILLMGVDATSDKLNANGAFNGDTLMLISFNPHTLSSTVFSIPRDTYVPIACLKGESSKINSAAAYGTECVINTVQNLTNIKIDYYVKINFRGVVNLVDALGGINITVPDGIDFCEQDSRRSMQQKDLQCIKSGYQYMNGEKALAFARHRKTLPAGDFQRVQHQQLVVEGIANSAKNLNSINDFYKILETISMSMDTNMTSKDMMNLYNVGKNLILNSNNGSAINMERTYLTGYDLTMYVNNLRGRVYTFQYYEESLKEIVKAMNITLGKEEAETVKTFNFSINEPYKVPIIGKKYYTVQRNETLPDFTGKSLSYVQSWCKERNINVYVTEITDGASGYDSSKEEGTVIKQSVSRGILTKEVSNITVNVIKHNNANSNPIPETQPIETITTEITTTEEAIIETTTTDVISDIIGTIE